MDIVEAVATHMLALLVGVLATRHRDPWRRSAEIMNTFAQAARDIVAEARRLATVVVRNRQVAVTA